MLFNSVHFLYFALFVIPLYWTLPKTAQNVFLLAASYYFYGSVHGAFLWLIVISTIVDYAMARCIDRDRSRTKVYVAVSIATNLGILGYFKYCNFFVGSAVALLQSLGLNASFHTLSIILPVGISFYTFQTMSYTVDVAMGRMRSHRNILEFALYVGLFTQLVAGPIERAGRLLPQLAVKRSFSRPQFYSGCYLILYGLAKKIVIADNVAILVDVLFSLDNPCFSLIVVGVLGFAVQIYADFSGYSDIARGLAKTLGIELMFNFNLPYFARSPSEFWRRWHISLSEWVRDYIYIPLGGGRHSGPRMYFNLFVAFTLSGLWHGASMNFVLWGFYHAIIFIAFKLLIDKNPILRRFPQAYVSIFTWGLTLVLVLYGWLLFRIRDFSFLVHLHKIMFDVSGWNLGVIDAIAVLSQIAIYTMPLLLVEAIQFASGDTEILTKRHWAIQLSFCTFLLLACVLFGVEDNAAFIYFQF